MLIYNLPNRMLLCLSSLLFILSLFHQAHAHESWALAFELPDSESMCFYQQFKEAKRMMFSFEVVRGGNSDVDILIESPNGMELYKRTKQQEGEYEFETSWGIFSFCFSNEFSTFTHKVIYFELRPHDHDSLANEAGKKKPSVDTQVEHYMENIHAANSEVVDMQRQYKMDEIRDRSLAEDLNSRVQWWSIGEAFIVVIVGVSQVYMLKTLFAGRLASQTLGPRTKSVPILMSP